MPRIANRSLATHSDAMSKYPVAISEPSHLQMSLDPWVIVAFIWPITRIFSIDFVGTLFLQDALSMALFGLLIIRRGSIKALRHFRWIYILGALWLLNQIITDIYIGSDFDDYSRGWFKIIFFFINLTAMALFLPERPIYLVSYALGMAIAYRYSVDLGSVQGEEANRWRFGYGAGLTIIIATLATGRIPGTARLARAAPALLLAAAFYILLQNARAQFGITFAAAMLCGLSALLNRSPRLRENLNPRTFTVLLLASFLAAQAPILLYSAVAEKGYMGDAAEQKFETQKVAGGGNIILGGRSELNVSLIAIKDSPILGHGSWARDSYYNSLLRHKMLEQGIKWYQLATKFNAPIPSHSYVFGSWVDGGIMGGVFWIFIIGSIITSIYYSLRVKGRLTPLFFVSAIDLIWNVLFSPFGSPVRFNVGFELVMITFTITEAQRILRAQAVSAAQPYLPRSATGTTGSRALQT